nr:exodeoxyribonuclease VII large subunit [Gemmatimonadota bacterium]
LPACPDRVGVITSMHSAAFHDMDGVLRRRAWWIPVTVAHTPVEGADAAPEIATAIRRFGATREECPVDVVILARGGGSMESLWGFNTEPVARAIADCPVPVISAVGHATDHTVADLVADHRAATPTAGAECAVPDGREVADRISADGAAIRRALVRRLTTTGTEVDFVVRHLDARSPRRLVERSEERAVRATEAMHEGMRGRLLRLGEKTAELEAELHWYLSWRVDAAERTLAAKAGALDARSPLRVLARGYALLSDAESGRGVHSARSITGGERLRVRLADGTFVVRAEGSLESLPEP